MVNQNSIVNIIDADTILFLLAYNLRDEQDVNVCKYNTDTFIRTILSNTNSHYYLGFLGGNGNFRKELSLEYKAKRPDRPEYMVRWEPIIRHILINDWGFKIVDGIEAEDAAIITANHYRSKSNVILSHVDKDMSFWEGNHYNYQKHQHWYSDKLGKIELVKGKIKGCGLRFYYSQLLLGDVTDGVSNVKKGFGAKRAYNVLKDCSNEFSLFSRTYRTFLSLSNREHFILQKKLIGMLQEPDYGFTIPEPIEYKKDFNIEDLI